MHRTIVYVATLAVATLAFTPSAHATPIKYEITGSASGKIGATTFANATVDLVALGDTGGVTSLFSGQIFGNPFSSFSITIGGVGTATITDLSEIWAVPTVSGLGNTEPIVVFGRIDAPPALDSITGIGATQSNALSGYMGDTAIGPITSGGGIGFPVGCSTPGHDPCLHTTLGLLSFTTNALFSPDTRTTFTATVNPVPEPATLFLLGSGVVALVGRRRARQPK